MALNVLELSVDSAALVSALLSDIAKVKASVAAGTTLVAEGMSLVSVLVADPAVLKSLEAVASDVGISL